MSGVKIISKVALAVFRNKKLLCVRSHKNAEVFYCLGGTVEESESDEEALRREVREEVGCEMGDKVELLETFDDWAHGRENTKVQIKLYQAELIGEPKPSAEIAEIEYLDSQTDPKKLSAIAIHQMFPWLKETGFIN
jgi:8-oxo-dGTP pyrophosphatase MutT (NUDIX family)